MATGRMLKKSITTSEKVNRLSDKAALLYTWLIDFLDDFGLVWASPQKIKLAVVPGRKLFTLKKIAECIKEMLNACLVNIVKIEDKEWIWFPDFLEKQTLKKDRKPFTYLENNYEWNFMNEISNYIMSGNFWKPLNSKYFQLETQEEEEEEEEDYNTPYGKQTSLLKDYNNKLFLVFKQIVGYSPMDSGKDRQKYPRLIRKKYKDLTLVEKALQWALQLHNKQGLYYWRANKISLAKLYHKILPAYLEEIQKRQNLKKIIELKKLAFKSIPQPTNKDVEEMARKERELKL